MNDGLCVLGNGKSRQRRDFDSQADGFERHAGLGREVAARVAAVVVEWVRPGPEDAMLELGAGTGEIGWCLHGAGGRYVGLDASGRMLGVGVRRGVADSGGRDRPFFVVADCDERWPIGDGAVRCVFASRVAHLLDVGHVVGEVRRVGCGDVWWIMGRTRRDPAGYREVLRDRMRQALVERGMRPREGRQSGQRFIEAMSAGGGVAMAPVDVARWVRRGTVEEVLAGWRAKDDLAGAGVDLAVRDAVLDEVERWALGRFGGLTVELESAEVYALTAVRFSK